MPADSHCNRLGHARANEIAHGAASQVVRNQAPVFAVVAVQFLVHSCPVKRSEADLHARVTPCFAEGRKREHAAGLFPLGLQHFR